MSDPGLHSAATNLAQASGIAEVDTMLQGLLEPERERIGGALATLWRSAARPELVAAIPPAPATDAPLDETIAWCGERLGEVIAGGREAPFAAWRAGLLLGVCRDTFAHGGWAATAAAIAAVDAGIDPPAWDELVREASIESTSRAATVLAEAALALHAPRSQAEALAAIGWPAVGREIVQQALAGAVAAIRGAAPVAVVRPAALLDHGIGAALAWTEGAATPVVTAPGRDLRPALIGWLESQAVEPWSWAALAGWIDHDPLVWAKAIARVARAPAWVASLDDVRREVAAALLTRIEPAWRMAVESLRASQPGSDDPVAVAVATVAEVATEQVARRLGETIAAGWAGTVRAGDLFEAWLTDPRRCPEIWRSAGAPVIAALARRG